MKKIVWNVLIGHHRGATSRLRAENSSWKVPSVIVTGYPPVVVTRHRRSRFIRRQRHSALGERRSELRKTSARWPPRWNRAADNKVWYFRRTNGAVERTRFTMGRFSVLSEYRLVYYGGLLLLLFLLLHISIKLFFSSLFAPFFPPLSRFVVVDVVGGRKKNADVSKRMRRGASRKRSRKIFSISFIWIFWYSFFMSPVYVFLLLLYSVEHIFCELGVRLPFRHRRRGFSVPTATSPHSISSFFWAFVNSFYFRGWNSWRVGGWATSSEIIPQLRKKGKISPATTAASYDRFFVDSAAIVKTTDQCEILTSYFSFDLSGLGLGTGLC